jgi:AcrR family transcriptional regulator
MGRPPATTADDFVDAAVELFAGGGARAVTMSAVIQRVGVSNGSLYHRFSDRPALLAATWLRTQRRFEDGYRDMLESPVTADKAITATVWIVDWCRIHRGEAVVLQAGARTLEPDTWSPADQAELERATTKRNRELATIVHALAGSAHRRDQIAFALFDLPLAVVRRHLLAGKPPPPRASTLVKDIATMILTPQGD